MVDLNTAEEILNTSAIPLEYEYEELVNCLGRINYDDIRSQIDLPPFDRSMMDGFALIKEDNSLRFKIIDNISTGEIPEKGINYGACSRIMTGAIIPHNANIVFRKEFVEEDNGYIIIKKQEKYSNISKRGEDIKSGNILLKKNSLIKPQEIAAISSIGLKKIKVYKKPSIGILCIGNEIIEPGNTMEGSKIYNSNAFSLIALLQELGVNAHYYGIIPANFNHLSEFIKKSTELHDITIISGGITVGDLDFVPKAIEENNFTLSFSSIEIKPGNRTIFAYNNNKYILGLPGNTVSSFMIFKILVKPFIYLLMGYKFKKQILKTNLHFSYSRKNSSKTELLPVKYDHSTKSLQKFAYNGSGHITSMVNSNGILIIDKGISSIDKDTEIDIILF